MSTSRPGILITGGSGLLATNWALAVRGRYSVTLGLHRRQVALDGMDCRIVSLESVDAIVSAIKNAGATTVIHTAAMTGVDDCERAPSEASAINVDLARNVAQACTAGGAKLVHISTDHVFSGTHSMMDENAAIEPINVYARTKAMAEIAVLDACPSAIVARTNFYGWGLPYRKSFSDTILEALRSTREIGLFRDAYFTPILMEILIEAIHQLITADSSGIYHVVGDERLSKYEFGLRLAKAFDLNADLVRPTFLAERRDLAPRPLDLSLANYKLRSCIGRDIGDIADQFSRLRASEVCHPPKGMQVRH